MVLLNKSLSIPEWHRLAQNGTSVPVRIPLMGYSMFPLVRYNRDLVTIIPIEEPLRIGDIVLFSNRRRNTYVMHRIWDINDSGILTWGDNCSHPDGWIPREDILGKAVLIERGKRKIVPDPEKGMRWARFWHKAGKVYRLYPRYKDGIARRVDKLKNKLKQRGSR